MVKTNSNDSLERKQTCVTFSGIRFQVLGVTRGRDVAQLAIEVAEVLLSQTVAIAKSHL